MSALIPLSVLMLIDYYAGWWPVLTLLSLVVFLPIGALFTSRAALDEMNKVIAQVAPPAPEDTDDFDPGANDAGTNGAGVFRSDIVGPDVVRSSE